MSSLITLSKNFVFFSSSSSSIDPTTPCSMSLSIRPTTHVPPLHLAKDFPSLGVSCLFPRRKLSVSKVWGGEVDPDLEAEVLEFMKNSLHPDSFPTKEQLIIGGRFDLVKKIAKQGGWLSMGWGLDDDKEEEEMVHRDELREGGNGFLSNDSIIFQNRFDAECNSMEAGTSSSSLPPSSSGRMGGEEDGGIEGILSRLEKSRNWSFGSKEKETKVPSSWSDDEHLKFKIPKADSNKASSSLEWGSDEDLFDDSGGAHFQSDYISDSDDSRRPFKPDTWRKWSNTRAGMSNREFEAAEIEENIIKNDEIVAKGGNKNGKLKTELQSGDKEKDYNYIRSRLRYLESELSSVLRLLGRQTDLAVPDKVQKRPSEESQSLSDVYEFRETEIMKARDKLRSLRAQVAVLEGKMALKIIEAQKLVDVKQKKLNDARRALGQLRTACVIWPKVASEVLLVGSFDGWTSQRKMQQSSPGIFSLYLRLYPGRYEIKFIVDGVWMIDPLRPIVGNDGYENNLLIIT